jgi:uncharacterized protein (TIGR03118 family)
VTRRPLRLASAALVVAAALALGFTARHSNAAYTLRPLVGDHGVKASHHDAQLVNAWGLAASPTGPWWTTNEARESSTLYSGTGRKQLLTVHVDGGPTGVVYYGGKGFVVHGGGHSDPARFIYACEDGRIRAWTPTVPGGWSNEAVVAVDDAGLAAIFRGLAIHGERLYATDFHSGRVDVFDSKWRLLKLPPDAFTDPQIPAWDGPFGIQVVDRHVFVSFEYRAPVNGNDAPTGGYVDEFTLDGKLLARLPHAHMNEPWGMALAPKSFGRFGGDLLVANFGDGSIRAYKRSGPHWHYDGVLAGKDGKPLLVNGLWGIAFGNGEMAGPRNELFFASGPHTWRGPTEQSVHGLVGSISPA